MPVGYRFCIWNYLKWLHLLPISLRIRHFHSSLASRPSTSWSQSKHFMLTTLLGPPGTEPKSASSRDRMNPLHCCTSFWRHLLARLLPPWLVNLRLRFRRKTRLKFMSTLQHFWRMLVILNLLVIASLYLSALNKFSFLFGRIVRIGLNIPRNLIKYGAEFKNLCFNMKNPMLWFNSQTKKEQPGTTQRTVPQRMPRKSRKFLSIRASCPRTIDLSKSLIRNLLSKLQPSLQKKIKYNKTELN